MPRRWTTADQAQAMPLVALSALGLGPLTGAGGDGPPAQRFTDILRRGGGRWMAADTSGSVGSSILRLLAAFGGSITDEEIRFQIGDLDLDLFATELERLMVAGLVELGPDGAIRASDQIAPHLGQALPSLSDYQAMSSDELASACRKLGLQAPKRKGERVAAIAAHFADQEGRQLVRKKLTPKARALLEQIVDGAGPDRIDCERIGIDQYHLHQAAIRRSYRHEPARPGPARPLAELVELGIVGTSPWEGKIWLWREAVPLLERPLLSGWSVAPRPERAPIPSTPSQLPPFVTSADQALRRWAESPPKVLKNGEPRLGKTDVRSTAKALGTAESAVDLAAGALIDIGLLLANTVAASGRGRKRTIDQVWRPDPALFAAWDQQPLVDRWARLVATWCRPAHKDHMQQLLANRHLALFELAILDPGQGYVDDQAFAAWLEHRYAPLAVAEAVEEVVADLRTLGLIPTQGPVGLTDAARTILDDPAAASTTIEITETTVVVQGDLTIVAPPGLDPEISARLAELATVEGEGAVQVLRLEEGRITKVVQGGQSADDILDFLATVSSVPLVDAVTRLVHDAARRADRVRLLTATTVVVVDDPADLTLACSIKSAKLTAVTDTVAISSLPLDKLRAALDRKGLAPALASQPDAGTARTASDEIEQLEAQAERARQFATRHDNAPMAASADRLERLIDELSDPVARLTASGPLALTPIQLASFAEPIDDSLGED